MESGVGDCPLKLVYCENINGFNFRLLELDAWNAVMTSAAAEGPPNR